MEDNSSLLKTALLKVDSVITGQESIVSNEGSDILYSEIKIEECDIKSELQKNNNYNQETFEFVKLFNNYQDNETDQIILKTEPLDYDDLNSLNTATHNTFKNDSHYQKQPNSNGLKNGDLFVQNDKHNTNQLICHMCNKIVNEPSSSIFNEHNREKFYTCTICKKKIALSRIEERIRKQKAEKNKVLKCNKRYKLSQLENSTKKREGNDEYNYYLLKKTWRENNEMDECSIFGQLITTKLQSMDEPTRQILMNDIHCVMCRATISEKSYSGSE